MHFKKGSRQDCGFRYDGSWSTSARARMKVKGKVRYPKFQISTRIIYQYRDCMGLDRLNVLEL